MNNSHFDKLAPLKSFDPAVFMGNVDVPESVCQFVLTLAVIFNDAKNILEAQIILQNQKPDDLTKLTRATGAYHGINNHVLRLFIGITNELMSLINENKSVLENKTLKLAISHLAEEDQKKWRDIVDISCGDLPKTPIGKFIILVRHKVVFHYNSEQIYAGYNRFFKSGVHGSEKAFVSLGKNVETSRLYFADAAITGYLNKLLDGKDERFIIEALKYLLDLCGVILNLVESFIYSRRYKLNSEEDE